MFLQVVLVFFFCVEKFHLRNENKNNGSSRRPSVWGLRNSCFRANKISGIESGNRIAPRLKSGAWKYIRHTAARSRQEKCQGQPCYNFSLCAQFNFSDRAQEKRLQKASKTSHVAIPLRAHEVLSILMADATSQCVKTVDQQLAQLISANRHRLLSSSPENV